MQTTTKIRILKPPRNYTSLLTILAIAFAVPVVSQAADNENGVEAVQFGKSLYIFGDEYNNAIRIGQIDNGDIVVHGIECNGESTTVNADSDDDLAIFSDVKNIFVNMGGGDDCVAASNDLLLLSDCLDLGEGYFGEPEISVDLGESIFIPGELEIVTGSGNDEVYVGGFETGGAMEFYTQAGDDDVGLCDIYVGTNLLAYTSSGEDQFGIFGFEGFTEPSFDELEGPLNYVRYKALINTGQDNDEVCVESLFTDKGQLKILTFGGNDNVFVGDCNPFTDPEMRNGEGNDSIGFVDVGTLLTVDTGPGHDNAAIGNTVVGTTLIAVLGGGIDEFWMEEVSVGRSTIIDTGDENDDVWINYTDTELDLVLHTRGGQDEAFIVNSLVGGNLVATLGSDSDGLLISNVGVSRLTFVNAGSGNDDVFVDSLDSDPLSVVMAGGDDALWIAYSTGSRLYANGGSGTDCFDESDNDFGSENVRSFELECDD